MATRRYGRIGKDCQIVVKGSDADLKRLKKTMEKGTNNPITQKNLEIFLMPDIDINNPDQVKIRITEYFKVCAETDSKPTMAGLAMALGMNRHRLTEIKYNVNDGHGIRINKVNPESIELIRKTYDFLEMQWEDYMLNGKVNPAAGIFIGKNQFDYRDVIDQRVAVADRNEIDAESIRKRYLTENSDLPLPDNSGDPG